MIKKEIIPGVLGDPIDCCCWMGIPLGFGDPEPILAHIPAGLPAAGPCWGLGCDTGTFWGPFGTPTPGPIIWLGSLIRCISPGPGPLPIILGGAACCRIIGPLGGMDWKPCPRGPIRGAFAICGPPPGPPGPPNRMPPGGPGPICCPI